MQIRNDLSVGEPTTRGEYTDLLLYRRMAVLGLDLYTIECGYSQTFDKMKRRCANCRSRDACVADLQHDPKNSLWETYCPNSGVLSAAHRGLEAVSFRPEDLASKLGFFHSLSTPW